MKLAPLLNEINYHDVQNQSYWDRTYYHGISGRRLLEYQKTGIIPDAQQAFGGNFSITDDFDLAKGYTSGTGIILAMNIKPNTSVELGDPFDEEFTPDGDITDVGEGEFLVNNPDVLLRITQIYPKK